MKINIYWKERLYYALSVITTLLVYLGLGLMILGMLDDPTLAVSLAVFGIYFIIIAGIVFFSHIAMIGHLQGNAVRVSEKQFPEVYNILVRQCDELNLKKVPTLYLMQSGGILNAFATRFVGRNYVVLYSEIFEKAYSDGIDVVKFILAHELVHVKRKHVLKRFWILPANVILLLTLAYSRACEVTCDRTAHNLVPEGSRNGLVILTAGKNLYPRINVEQYLLDASKERTFAKWFAEVVSTHPHISRRLRMLIQN